MDDKTTYDCILWILAYLKQQQVPPDVTECIRIIEGRIHEIEMEYEKRFANDHRKLGKGSHTSPEQ